MEVAHKPIESILLICVSKRGQDHQVIEPLFMRDPEEIPPRY